MLLTLRYFGALRDRLGREAENRDIADVTTAGAAIDALMEQDSKLASALRDFPRARYAINQRFATRTAMLADGDELAIFPPVTGG